MTLPPGHQPYDPLNALRVGGLAGALAGAALGWLSGASAPLLIVGGTALGAAAGYWRQRRRRPSDADRSRS